MGQISGQITPLPGYRPTDAAARPLPSAWLGGSGTMKDQWVWDGLTGTGTPLLDAFTAMHERSLRYPGGSVSRGWDYVKDVPAPPDFLDWCEEAGIAPVLVVRISDEVNDVGDLVPVADIPARAAALRAALGSKKEAFTHVEIGNELYSSQQFPSVAPTSYAEAFVAS